MQLVLLITDIKNIFHLPGLKRNLLSLKKLEMLGFTIIFEKGVDKIRGRAYNLD